MQVNPVTTQLRDEWDAAIEDGHVCHNDMTRITRLIARADDGVRLALGAIKAGPDTRRIREGREEFERLHGPICLRTYKKRRRDGNPDSAA